MPSDDHPGLEADDDEPGLEREPAEPRAPEPEPSLPPHLEGQKYLPGLEGDPKGAILENWTDTDWEKWAGDNSAKLFEIVEIHGLENQDDQQFAEWVLERANVYSAIDEFVKGDWAWEFSKLSSPNRERFFHLFDEVLAGDAEPPEPQKGGPSTKAVAVIAGATLAVVLVAVLIVLMVRDGDGDDAEPVAVVVPTSAPAEEPPEPDPPADSATADEPPAESEDSAASDDTTAEGPVVEAPVPDDVPGATITAVLIGRTPEGSDQVQVLLAGDGRAVADDPATESYEVDLTVTDEASNEFFFEGEFVDAATYVAEAFDSDGNPIVDASATAEFFDGGIFIELSTPGSLPAATVRAELRVVIDGNEVVSEGSSDDTSDSE